MAQGNRHREERRPTRGRTVVQICVGALLSFGAGAAVLLVGAALLFSGKLDEDAAPRLCLLAGALGGLLGGAWAAFRLRWRVLVVALGAAALGAGLWLLTDFVLGSVSAGSAVRLLLCALGGGVLGGAMAAR